MPISDMDAWKDPETGDTTTIDFEGPGGLELHVMDTPGTYTLSAALYCRPDPEIDETPSLYLACTGLPGLPITASANFDDGVNSGNLLSIRCGTDGLPTVDVRIIDHPKNDHGSEPEASYFTFTVDELRRFGLSKS